MRSACLSGQSLSEGAGKSALVLKFGELKHLQRRLPFRVFVFRLKLQEKHVASAAVSSVWQTRNAYCQNALDFHVQKQHRLSS